MNDLKLQIRTRIDEFNKLYNTFPPNIFQLIIKGENDNRTLSEQKELDDYFQKIKPIIDVKLKELDESIANLKKLDEMKKKLNQMIDKLS